MQQEAIETHDHAWERLVKAAVHRAIYNAEPRALSPCLEDTRTTILKSIREVVDEKSQKNVWLYGSPGSGKTSILFTIAEELRAQGRLAGTFFFSQNSSDTTMCDYVVPTLAYQLALAFPSVKNDIIRTVADDPALLSDVKSRQDQIQCLIIKHLWRLQFRSPVAFIIDALDESCSPRDAVRVAHLLAEAIRSYKEPLNAHIILASRTSLHVDGMTLGKGFRDTQEISLQDYDEETSADIYHFLADELQQVVQSRKLGLADVSQWPSPRQMVDLADKVGNSFLCASIAMKYIAHPRKNPASRLDAFLSSPDATAVAYADLDNVYHDIIKDNRTLIRHLIDIINLAQPLPRSQLLQFFPPGDSEGLNLALEEFSSILVVPPDQPMIPIQPYHSSLIEFFANPMRCRPHYTDSAEIHRGLAYQSFIILHELKANLCDLSDHTTMAIEDSHFWHKRDTVLPQIRRYACRHWAHHLSRANCNEDLFSALEKFLRDHILHWIEALCLLGELGDGPAMLRKARAAFSGWARIMPRHDFTLMNRSLATAEQLIILYHDPISLFPLQVYYIVAALADLSGKPLDSNCNVLVRRCGPAPDNIYQFPVSGLRSSLVNPGLSQGRHVEEVDSKVLGVLADCCRWLSNSELGAFHLSDLTLEVRLSRLDIESLRKEDDYLHLRSHVGPIEPRRLWVCLELISENSKQVSSVQRITHSVCSEVKLGSMIILAEADHRCRLRILLSTSKWKPAKPGMILGEWLFNFRSLIEHADSNNPLKLCMYDQHESPLAAVGSLCFAISPTPDFSASKHGQISVQCSERHPSNLLPGIFTTHQTKKDGDPGEVLQGPGSQRGLPSVLDLNLTFKEPDEREGLIRQVTTAFRDLLERGRLYMLVVWHPIRYRHYRRHSNQFGWDESPECIEMVSGSD